jgi:dihydroneopterin aldolase
MDTVFLYGLSVQGKHGVMERERHVEQEFVLDMVADVDTRSAAISDKIEDTVDYVRFRDIAEDVIRNESHYLIERVAERIAVRILEDALVKKIAITIRKPAVLPNGIPGITIVRAQA